MNDWTIEQLLLAVIVTGVVMAAGIWATFGLLSYALKTAKKPAQDGGSESRGWAERLAREPIRVRTAIVGVLAVGASFGLPVTETQQAVIVGAVLGVLTLLSETTRHKVTPVDHPNMEAIEEAKAG